MTFRRTNSSLHSLHVFFKVDVVVFCEGGNSLTFSEAILPDPGCSTLDTLYWRSVVNTYNLTKKFHFKSVGGKETILEIADEINRSNIQTISVCMDSDYHRLIGRAVTFRRSACTFGYSWENDVVQLPVLEGIVTALVGMGPECTNIIEKLRVHIDQLERDLLRWTEIDVSLLVRGRGCLFDRKKPLSAIDMTAPPRLREAALLSRLSAAGYRRRPKRVVEVIKSEVIKICYGKLISKAMYHTFISLISGVVNEKISYDLFMRLAVREAMVALAGGLLPSFSAHVRQQKIAFD